MGIVVNLAATAPRHSLREAAIAGSVASSSEASRDSIGEVAQDGEEVRHGLASAGFAATDGAKRDAFLRQLASLMNQPGESLTS